MASSRISRTWRGTMALLSIAALTGCGSTTGTTAGTDTSTDTAADTGTGTTTTYGAYTLTSGTAHQAGNFTSTTEDQSAVLVSGTGELTLTNALVITTASSSSTDDSSFYGLNAAVLAKGGGVLTLSGGSVSTSGTGANGLFAYGSGSSISASGTSINCSGPYAHGIMASGGGQIAADDLTVRTTGANAAAVATDKGGGSITVYGGSYTSTGSDSPGLYSTGTLRATSASFAASGSEAAVVEGSNSIALTNCELTTSKSGKWGVLLYQSASGDAQGAEGSFSQTGGSLSSTASDSPLFYVTNTQGTIDLAGVTVNAGSGLLLRAAAGSWGTSGANGGTAILNATGQTLTGNLALDALSSISLNLANGSTLTGAINTAGTAGTARLTLDTNSTWTVTASSRLTSITGAAISGTSITNIVGNGYRVTYDASATANSYLGGQTYTLAGGGTLAPAF